jgi:hypothetical protein
MHRTALFLASVDRRPRGGGVAQSRGARRVDGHRGNAIVGRRGDRDVLTGPAADFAVALQRVAPDVKTIIVKRRPAEPEE